MLSISPVADSGLLDINGTLFAEILAFLVMLAILARYAYPPIIRAAEERQRQIEEGLKSAAEAEQRLRSVQEEVEKTLAESREHAREVIARAHQEATADADAVRAKARKEAEAIVDKARADIDTERDRALQELRAQVSGLVVDAAAKVLGQAIDARAHERLIEESISSVSSRT